jgi:hypothetical protein
MWIKNCPARKGGGGREWYQSIGLAILHKIADVLGPGTLNFKKPVSAFRAKKGPFFKVEDGLT